MFSIHPSNAGWQWKYFYLNDEQCDSRQLYFLVSRVYWMLMSCFLWPCCKYTVLLLLCACQRCVPAIMWLWMLWSLRSPLRRDIYQADMLLLSDWTIRLPLPSRWDDKSHRHLIVSQHLQEQLLMTDMWKCWICVMHTCHHVLCVSSSRWCFCGIFYCHCRVRQQY